MKRKIYNFLLVLTMTASIFACKDDDDPTVSKIDLSKTALTLLVGEDTLITATVTPTNAINKTITWSSDNEDVATVNANGNIEAIAPGTARIAATSKNGKKVECTVTVVNGYRFDGELKEIETAVWGDYSGVEGGGGYQFWFFPTEEAEGTFDAANEYIWIDIPKEMVGTAFPLTEENLYDWGWWITHVIADEEIEYAGFGAEGQMEDVQSGTMNAVVKGEDTFEVTADVLYTDGKKLKIRFVGTMAYDDSYYGGGRVGGRKAVGKGNAK